RLAALLAKDLRGIVRDRLLLFLLGYGVVIAAVLRLVLPLVPVENLGIYVAPAAPLIGILLVGSVLGLGLVDERESGTWLLLRVLPVSDASLGAYLCSVAAGVGLVAGVACALVYGQPVERPLLYGAALLSASLGAPALAFFIGSLASNKIEAMAIGKLANIPMAAPILAFVLPAPWHLFLWWSPSYWIYLALLRGAAPEAALRDASLVIPELPDAAFVAIPVLLLVGSGVPLVRRFRVVAS
ncbi:MAG: hypothetical protein CL910_02305, partial [Deltaproteobacteria bacterium]|nr:hypothetical protein [Deltaproteobacteria bacterium]